LHEHIIEIALPCRLIVLFLGDQSRRSGWSAEIMSVFSEENMSSRYTSFTRRVKFAVAFAALSAVAPFATAADITKADNLDNLEIATSWVNGIAPTVADVALFNSTLAANSAFTLGANQTWGGLRLTNPFAGVSIGGTSTLTIGRFGIDMSAATQDLTINAPVTIQGAPGIYDWNVAAGRTLTLAALPTKIGRTTPTGYNVLTAGHMGIVRMSTTGTIRLGAAATTLLIDNQNNPYALYGNNDWAATDATGQVVAATYTDNTGNLTNNSALVNNIVVDALGPNATDMAAIRFNDPTARTVVISNSGSSRTATLRGILVTENSGGGTITNTGGGIGLGFIRPNRTSTGAGQITNFPVIQNSASDFTIGAILGTASASTPVTLVKYGSGKLILTNANGQGGGLTITEGAVEAGGDIGTFGNGAILNNGSLIFNRTSGTYAVANFITGSGSIEFKGAGTYTLSGANTYTAVNNINGGLVEPTSAAALGTSNTLNFNGGGYRYNAAYTPDLTTYTHTVGANGVTIDTNGQTATFAGNFGSGSSGGLQKIGAGTLTLNGASNYGGATIVNGGRLNVNGNVAGSVSVSNGSTLGGTGAIGGLTTIASGATLSPGTSVGTLTTGGLTLDAGSLLNVEFASPSSYDKVVVTGSGGLTINGGGVSLFNDGTTDPYATSGSYQLIQFAGGIQGTGTSVLSVLNPAPGKSYAFNVLGNNVVLSISNTGVAAQWNVDANGSWNTASNWVGGVPNGSGDTASFTKALTANRTVTLDGNKTIGGATFNTPSFGYTITAGSGGSLTFGNGTNNALLFVQGGNHAVTAPVVMASTAIIETSSDTSLALNGAVSGAGALTKAGGGTLSLGNASNTYGGATTVNGGTLAVAAIGSLGSNATLNLNGGGVIKYAAGMTNDLSTAKTVTLGAGGGGIDTNGNDVTFATSLPGVGGLVKAGAGRLTLTAANTYTGATTVSGGALNISSNDQLGDPTAAAGLTLNGGTLEVAATLTLTGRSLTVDSNGGTIDVFTGQILTLSGTGAGAGQLIKKGGGSAEFTAGSARTGETRIEEGFVTHGVSGSLGSGQVDLVGGALNIGATRLNNTLNVIGTAGPVGVVGGSGGGLTDLTTVIGAGTLVVNITGGVFDLEGDMTAFTGTLDVVNAGGAAIRLNGTTLSSGMTLNLGAGTGLSRRNTTTSYNIGALTGTGNINAVTSVTGNTTYVIGGKNIDATFDGVIGDSINGTTGVIDGSTIITKVGTGKQVFNGENYYTGVTTVQAGTLQLGPNAQTPVFGGNTPITGFPVVGGGADILGGKLVLDYTGVASPAANVLSILDAGYDQATKFSTGSLRATVLAPGHLLGWKDNVAANTVTIANTLAGDTDVNLSVNFDDLLTLAQNYSASATDKVWAQGDFNYDGFVNFDDLLGLAQNYGGSAIAAEALASNFGAEFAGDWAAAMSMVPEPTSISLLAGGLLLTRRRRD
jgi:autotransporter-associated beta strand protein